jgi:putative hydrolase of HD superfamily
MEKTDNGEARNEAVNPEQRIVDFLFEVGTMKKLPRMHRQTLLTDDTSDTIASHSYRTAMIAWHLAKMEGVDPYKTVMMCLIHDMPEARSGDHNWVHKKYVKIFEDEIIADQFGTLPFEDLFDISNEYNERQSRESIVAKDADLLDQIFLLREYEWQGNKEAIDWLAGKNGNKGNAQDSRLVTASAKKVAREALTRSPSAWWSDSWTSKNR